MSTIRSAELSLPSALYRAEQVRQLDRLAIASGIPGFELMRRAGAAAFSLLQQLWADRAPIEIFCGGGNNGGDGYVIAALAAQAGLPVRVWSLADQLKGDALLARQWADELGVVISPWAGQLPSAGAVVVDALLGTGLSGDVRPGYAEVIAAINQSPAPVLAVDIPSGLCSDTGRILACCVNADVTLSFIGLKQGLLTGAGPGQVGQVCFADLQVPRTVFTQVPPSSWRMDSTDPEARLPPRPRVCHKGQFGHVLVLGGDHGMAGAALLAATAAARSGAGLVSCATRPEHVLAFCAARPELMVHGVDTPAQLTPLLARCSVVVAGPGLGTSAWGQSLLRAAVAAGKPLLLDADALNLLATGAVSLAAPGGVVLTPHPAEAARLLGESTAVVQADRFAATQQLAQRFQAAVLLKGAGTVVVDGADRSGLTHVLQGGNPGMASGGMGDVLSGIIGALLAQGLAPGLAARVGACLHARAADIAAAEEGERGLLAMDVVNKLRAVVNGA